MRLIPKIQYIPFKEKITYKYMQSIKKNPNLLITTVWITPASGLATSIVTWWNRDKWVRFISLLFGPMCNNGKLPKQFKYSLRK